MPKSLRKHFYINDAKQRVTVTISNEANGITATTIVEHIETDSSGYTTATHAVFKDFFNRMRIGEKLKRVTTKVLKHWDSVANEVYQCHLPDIQRMYP